MSGYFTLAMLTHDCRISKGMKGIDPDGTDKERAAWEAAWFKAHPLMTAELREKLKADGEKKKELLHRARLKKLLSNIGPDGVSEKKGSLDTPCRGRGLKPQETTENGEIKRYGNHGDF
jgi:hypothetical protein